LGGHSFPSIVITVLLILLLWTDRLDDACVLLVMVWEGDAEDCLNKVGRFKQVVGILDDCSRYHFEFSFYLLQFVKFVAVVGDKHFIIVAISLLLASNLLFIFVVFRAGKGWEVFFELVADRYLLGFVFIAIFALFWD
jgi:hypothetical protein